MISFLVQSPGTTPEANAFAAFREALKIAVQGPLGLLGLLAGLAVFLFFTLRSGRLQRLLYSVGEVPAVDRIRVLTGEMGAIYLKEGMTPEEWIKAKNHQYVFFRWLAVLGVFAFVVTLAADNLRTRKRLLESFFSDSLTRLEAVEYLRTRQGLYHVDEPKLVDSLATAYRAVDASMRDSSPTAQYRRLSTFIDTQSLLRELRNRAERRSVPFSPLGTSVVVGLPRIQKERPGPCEVYVDRTSPLANAPLEVISPENQKRLVLRPVAAITGNSSSQVLIHLNEVQTGYLFPGGIGYVEDAIIIPRAASDTLSDPSSVPSCKGVPKRKRG